MFILAFRDGVVHGGAVLARQRALSLRSDRECVRPGLLLRYRMVMFIVRSIIEQPLKGLLLHLGERLVCVAEHTTWLRVRARRLWRRLRRAFPFLQLPSPYKIF